MKLNIKPTDYEGLNCMDGLLISLAESMNRDYALVFADAWNFSFGDETEAHPNTVGDRLNVCNVVNKELLRTYCGIGQKTIYESDITLEKFMPIIKEELSQQRPVMIIQDLFWCPWSKDFFQINHETTHSTFIIDYDEKGLICMDYALRIWDVTLPYEYFDKSVNTFVTLNITPEPPAYDFSFESIMDRVIASTSRFDSFNEIRRFGTYVRETFDPVKELQRFGIDNFGANPINWRIGRISTSRKLFALTLRALSKKTGLNILVELSNQLGLVIPKWLMVMSMIVKACLSSNASTLVRISDKIMELANYEESIFNCLVTVYNNPQIEIDLQSVLNSSNSKHNEQKLKVFHVNLSTYCNNRAFENNEGCTYEPDFVENKFIIQDNNICKGILSMSNISFKLVDVLADMYDNALCKSQVIELPNKCFSKIGLIGCSTNGNYTGELAVNYQDGHVETINFQLSDCYLKEAEFVQEILWTGLCVMDGLKTTNSFPCQIYGQVFDLQHKNNISSIILPDCPNMHIFAVSLAGHV